MTDWNHALDCYIDEISAELIAIRRFLHKHPEPSGEEFQTTLYLAQRLREANIPVRIVPSQRGIIADSPTGTSGPSLAMRADLDGLHIFDQKEVPYRSARDGVMHACGHDAHSTMALGASLALAHIEKELPWPCPWRAIFQPAEETSQGALEMIQAGALEGVRSIVALHVDPELTVGRVALRDGQLTANCQDLQVTIRGRGGHAARPHHALDPISAAVHFIGDVYQLIPRSVDSRDPVVLTFGVIDGGNNPNVIPESVTLRGTIRTLTKQSRQEVQARLAQIQRGVAEITGTKIEIAVDAGVDGVFNDHSVTTHMRRAAADVVGSDQIQFIQKPSMGAEDFANYLSHVPGCLLRLGVAAEDKPRHFLHSPRFDIDEQALAIGAKILARCLVYLARPAERSSS